jgi:two-component sensor histidine kinase
MNKVVCIVMLLAGSLLKAQHKGPIAEYTFNDGSTHDGKRKHDAKAYSVLFVDDRFGNHNSAVYTHGSPGSYLNLGTDTALKFPAATISLWIKVDYLMFSGKGIPFNPIIVTKNNNKEDFCEAYAQALDFNVKRFNTTTNLSEEKQVTLSSKDTVVFGQWYHLVTAYDDDSLYFYIDGKLNAKIGKGYRTTFLKNDSIVIGTTAAVKNERYLRGAVDDIMLYDRVLSPQEVYDLYATPDPNRYHIYFTWLVRILVAAGIIALISWLVIRRQKQNLEKEKEKSRVDSKMLELETRALRSQMNPHFVFNSLNTLQRFILQEDFKNSHHYLSKFSLLMRKLLESSSSDAISLADEIVVLNQYIEIEKLRFSNQFEFSVSSTVPLPEETHIPFMMVQPFAENAIWHGLLHKEGVCFLKVHFTEHDEKRIKCTIEDNGVGIKRSEAKKRFVGKKSMGIELIRQRTALLEKSVGVESTFSITDKSDRGVTGESGTIVEIIIPKLNS